MQKCVHCERPIPAERLAAIPETETCVCCSDVAYKTDADVELDGADRDDLVKTSRIPNDER